MIYLDGNLRYYLEKYGGERLLIISSKIPGNVIISHEGVCRGEYIKDVNILGYNEAIDYLVMKKRMDAEKMRKIVFELIGE